MNNQEILTPSQFYRSIRPEFFSDSKTAAKTVLPREQLDYEISKIAVNQKHDSFENLCRKLAERLISPNLIPQVGPTGGGDGKTDAETYPVSSFISDRWFISDNKWNENENWAFAISAKTDWKAKVKSDVKKIVETQRAYTKIYFFSNQKISSKNKKETQDQIRKDYSIELIILDAEWILENVYTNNLLNDVIETLNLSTVYLQETILGPNDIERGKELKELEDRINSKNRIFEVDYQLVEDCLESAIISRMLELPKAEVVGKFDRARRFADRLNNTQLKIRVHYQFAWTLINWYDEYLEFYREYLEVKLLVTSEPNLINIESYLNLFNILRSIARIKEVNDFNLIDFKKEEGDFISLLGDLSLNENKPSTALLSKFYLSLNAISNNLENESIVSEELKKLIGYFTKAKFHSDIPFEQLKEILEKYGDVLPDNCTYDELIDMLAEIESVRVSELSSGQTYLKRGVTKLKNDLNRESLVYFGKAARKFAKEETQFQFYYCLMLLGDAYSKLDLYWAAYSSYVAAANIYANIWFTTGNLHPRFLRSIQEILKNESIIGRVPIILCWYELFKVLKLYFHDIDEDSKGEIPSEHLTDSVLAVRLLNTPFMLFKGLTYLPDILNKNELWLSCDAVLYLLGNEEIIELDESKTTLTKERLPEYYNKFANQPFRKQMAYDTNLLSDNTIILETNILGIRYEIQTSPDTDLLILGESILAYFESFLATAFGEAFPVSEKIKLNITFGQLNNLFDFNFEDKSNFKLIINESKSCTGKEFAGLMDSILPQIVGNNYIFKDYKTFFEKLYRNDEVHERLSIILEHRNFLTNVFTDKPKFFLSDWKTNDTKSYDVKNTASPIQLEKTSSKNTREKTGKPNFDDATHKNIKAETIIDMTMWDEARWKAFGSFSIPAIPFGIFIGFEDGKYGKKIFERWIAEYGKIDSNEIISLTIIKGINKNRPHWYKVLVSKKIDKDKMKAGNFFNTTSRFHRMEPKDSRNLDRLISDYNKFRKYVLVPTAVDTNFNIEPFFDFGILKTELKVLNAWEIGLHDTERVVITKDDLPIIPENISNAPVLEVLREMKNRDDK